MLHIISALRQTDFNKFFEHISGINFMCTFFIMFSVSGHYFENDSEKKIKPKTPLSGITTMIFT
jgi:hypothetical protein